MVGIKDISPARLAALNSGAEATNLTECLAVDFSVLMKTIAPDLSVEAARIDLTAGISVRMRQAGAVLAAGGADRIARFANHPSDTACGWAAFASVMGFGLNDTHKAIRPFADDPHFGVREWAWMAARPTLAEDLPAAIAALIPWVRDPSERLRRFATEATRPRGVWCAHIAALKDAPELALPLLDPLHADPARYVQDSVANWLNDAGKTRPEFVRQTTARWEAQSDSKATAYIVKRARRSLVN